MKFSIESVQILLMKVKVMFCVVLLCTHSAWLMGCESSLIRSKLEPMDENLEQMSLVLICKSDRRNSIDKSFFHFRLRLCKEKKTRSFMDRTHSSFKRTHCCSMCYRLSRSHLIVNIGALGDWDESEWINKSHWLACLFIAIVTKERKSLYFKYEWELTIHEFSLCNDGWLNTCFDIYP